MIDNPAPYQLLHRGNTMRQSNRSAGPSGRAEPCPISSSLAIFELDIGQIGNYDVDVLVSTLELLSGND